LQTGVCNAVAQKSNILLMEVIQNGKVIDGLDIDVELY